MELGSAPTTVLFVPMPRMVTIAAPVCCEIVTEARRQRGPSRLNPSCSSVLAGSTVTAIGVVWMSAAPVFVAVTVTLSENGEVASTRSSAAGTAFSSTSAVRGSNPARVAVTRYRPAGKSISYLPCSPVATVRGASSAVPLTVTLTPVNTPPVVSRTTPDSHWADCADAVNDQ